MSHQFSNGAFNFVDQSAQVGMNTTIWHFAVILQDAIIGSFSSIGSRAEIGRGCRIGSRVRISSGVFLPSNAIIEDDVFIGPNCTFTDDKYPRAGNKEYKAEPPHIMKGASIGAGSVILPGIKIGRKAMVGAGSVVTKDVPDGATVRGDGAKLRYMTNFDIYAPVMGEHAQLRRDDLMDALPL